MKTHVTQKHNRRSQKDKNLRNGEPIRGLREAGNVGGAVADERVIGKVMNNIELR